MLSAVNHLNNGEVKIAEAGEAFTHKPFYNIHKFFGIYGVGFEVVIQC